MRCIHVVHAARSEQLSATCGSGAAPLRCGRCSCIWTSWPSKTAWHVLLHHHVTSIKAPQAMSQTQDGPTFVDSTFQAAIAHLMLCFGLLMCCLAHVAC